MEELTVASGRMVLTEGVPSPFMRLPKELALDIYEIAFQAYIDRATFIDHAELERLSLSIMPMLSSRGRSMIRRWTLSIFHVNRAMRKESFDACNRLLEKSMISTYHQRYSQPADISLHQYRIQMVQVALRAQSESEIKFTLSKVREGATPKPETFERKQEIMPAPDDVNQTPKNKMRQIIKRDCSEWCYMSREAEVDFDSLPLHVKQLLLQCVRD
ncbi:hypothetical protein Q7P35_001295 [Cladosporium inversicolor]